MDAWVVQASTGSRAGLESTDGPAIPNPSAFLTGHPQSVVTDSDLDITITREFYDPPRERSRSPEPEYVPQRRTATDFTDMSASDIFYCNSMSHTYGTHYDYAEHLSDLIVLEDDEVWKNLAARTEILCGK